MSSSTSPIESAFQPLHQGSATNSNISSPLCSSDSTSTNDATSSRPNLPSQMLRRNLLSSQHFASPTDNLMSPCSAKLQAHKYKYLTKGKPATTLSFGKPSSGGSLKSSSSLKDSSSPL